MRKPTKPATAPVPVASYMTLQDAFDHFNAELFGSQLPACMITLQRKAGTRGYFSPDRMATMAGDDEPIHEIALNPNTFDGMTTTEVLSVLVHEMAHLWQQCHGKPGRNGYHNFEWVRKMEALGLVPFAVDNTATGRQTGQKVSHRIDPHGRFLAACGKMGTDVILYRDRFGDTPTAAKKRASKTKYTCRECGQNAWAKPDACLICGHCQEEMDPEE